MMKGLGTAAASAAVLILSGAAGGAYAADLGPYPVKAPPAGPVTCTSILDFFTTACQVAAYGVRFYGTIDVGGDYMTNGSPMDKLAGPGVQPFLGKNSLGARWNLAPNGMTLSNVGFQVKEGLGGGWSFVGQVETGFNPYGLPHLANSPGSVQENMGLSLNQQLSPGDGSTNGKFYNDLGFAGFSNDTWGTLTFGRQNTLMKDGILSYDAFSNAYAFSYIGYFGATAGGGDTEDGKSTTAIKYRVNFANYHFGAFTQIGGYDAGNASQAVAQGNIGADYHAGPGVLSVEAIGGWTKGAVTEALSIPSLFPGVPNPAATNVGLGVTISDNVNMMALAKYTVDRLTLYAGYEWIHFANPSDPVTSFTDITGQPLCNGCTLNGQTVKISNVAYNFNKIQQVAWTGAKYALTNSVDLIGAYYFAGQNDYSGGLASAAAGGVSQTCSQNNKAQASCAGTTNAVSFAVDWKFAPKWDTYLGTLYSVQSGGMASGFLATSDWTTTAGVRFRW
jgi:predicted porin